MLIFNCLYKLVSDLKIIKPPTNYNLRIKYHKKETYPKFTNFEYASFN